MVEPLSPRQEIWRGLLYGQRSMTLRLGAALKQQFGLTLPQFEALLTLWECTDHALPTSALTRTLLYSSGSTSHLVGRLEQLGLVTRAACADDARVSLIVLTDAGERMIAAATERHLADLAEQFEPLISDDQVDPLLALARGLAEREGVLSQRPVPEE